jgi:GntR family transcriptional regulator
MADPLYQQIADDLREQIESGALPPGSQLRTELELREHYNASRNTVRDAIKSLITRGLVETRPGQGTFVTETIVPFVTTLTGDPETASGGEGNTYRQEVEATLRVPRDTDPEVGIRPADAEIASDLQISQSDQVISRHQQRSIDGTAWSLQTSYYPMRFVTEGGAHRLLDARGIPEGTVEYLRGALGLKQAGYRDKLIVRTPDQNETAFFKLPDDGRVSVIEIRRIAFDDNGAPMRLTVSVYPADRNQFALNLGKVPEQVMDPQLAGGTETARTSDVSGDNQTDGSG